MRHRGEFDWGNALQAEAAPASLRELRAARQAIEAILRAQGVEHMLSIDAARGGIDLFVRDRAALDALVARRVLSLPERTNVRTVPDFISREATFVGGEPNTNSTGGICTNGFAVFPTGQSANRGYSTAGHCEPPLSFQGVAMTRQNYVDAGRRDFAWYRAASGTHSYSPSVDLQNGTYRPIYYYMPLASMVDGNPICLVGDSTGWVCGSIYRHDVSYRDECCVIWVRSSTGGDLSQLGDSGGPWFYSNTAYGTHIGAISGFPLDAGAMPIEYIFSAPLNLSLLAAQQ